MEVTPLFVRGVGEGTHGHGDESGEDGEVALHGVSEEAGVNPHSGFA